MTPHGDDKGERARAIASASQAHPAKARLPAGQAGKRDSHCPLAGPAVVIGGGGLGDIGFDKSVSARYIDK